MNVGAGAAVRDSASRAPTRRLAVVRCRRATGRRAPTNFVGSAVGRNERYIYAAMRTGGGWYNQTSLGWQVGIFGRDNGRTFIRWRRIAGRAIACGAR
jgi:hypothetical protein